MRILTPWTQQPQVATEIDWGNPITRGLVIAENHSNPRLDAFNAPTKKVGPSYRGSGGVATRFVSASSQYFKQSNTKLTNYPLTFLSVFQRASRPFDGILIGIGAGTNRQILYVNQDNIACFSGAGGTTAQAASTNTELGMYGPGDARCAVGVVSAANSRSVYLDGVSVGFDSTTVSTGASNTAVIGCYWNNDAPSAYFNGDIYLSLAWNRALTDAEIRNISQNPWQIFKPIPRYIFAPSSAATGDGTGIGSLYAITLSSPTATAAGTANATATGSLAASTLTAPTGSASAGTSATATGAFAASSLSAPSATATGSALATGALTTVTLTTIPASATGSALATGTIDQIDLSTVTGNATGTTAGNATGVGSVAAIALSAPVATALGTALATGNFASIGLGTVSGSASAATDGQATAVIQPISISAPLAIAIASSVATGGIQSIGLTAPTGTASGQAQTIARPTSDISNTGWTPSTGSDLYAMLDEVSPDDADYISTSSVGAVCKFGMNATAFPGSASQQLSLRASSSTGNGLSVTIKDGATTIASRTLTLTPTFDLHTITLTSGEIAAITSGNLTVEMTST